MVLLRTRSDAARAIEREHQVLFGLMRALDALLADRGDPAELLAALNRYCREHFAGEEALMRECGYPESSAHRAEHRRLCGELAALAALAVEPASLRSAADSVAAALLRHTATRDRRLAVFLVSE